MKIIVNTNNAEDLRERIFQKAENNEIQTWEIRTIKGNKYLTHSAEQYIDKCYIRLTTIDNDTLVVKVVRENDVDSRIINIYYGRFIYALLNSFSELNEGAVVI
jgi:hypothetical protein